MFQEGIYVRHLDGNSLNNLDNNIAIGTHQENMMDKPVEQRRNAAIIATRVAQKHNHQDIINYYNQVKSYNKVMQYFGISSKGTVSFIIRQSIVSQE